MTKKIIYLFGAGATQAVIQDMNPEKSLRTEDIQEEIRKYSSSGFEKSVWNEFVTNGNDVEHLISVLESQYNYSTSEKLRKYYKKALVELANKVKVTKQESATLYTVLSDLHLNIISRLPSDKESLEEELLCYITLNYEDILEKSLKTQLKCEIDYTVKTTNPIVNGDIINIIKLHGSFTWTNTRPIQVGRMNKSDDALWIPPGVEKRKDNYPFNLLWGRANEFLLDCDVLRVVGCSLSRNDWGLIPILYTVQKFSDNEDFEIEIIDYPKTGKSIKDNYSYLNVKEISEIDVLESFYERKFPKAPKDRLREEIESKFADKDKTNAFQEWLDAKIEDLIENDIDIPEESSVHSFYYKD